MGKDNKTKQPAISEQQKSLPLESKGLKNLNEKFLQENTEKIKKEEGLKK
jgi:hypothetical protein